jgi:hypothetical protein
MKTIIIVASIFYILGLTFSNNLDISKKSSPVDSIATPRIIQHKPDVSIQPDKLPELHIETDSLKSLKTLEKG